MKHQASMHSRLIGAVVGSIIGGNVGSAVAQGTQFGLGTAFLRFSREFEREADLLGSHVMAAAGYDPREMASMFKTIQQGRASGGPSWLSDHPDAGDRYESITRESQLLTVRTPVHDVRAFTKAQRAAALAVTAVATSACATKKFVRTEVGDVNTKVNTLGTALDRGLHRQRGLGSLQRTAGP